MPPTLPSTVPPTLPSTVQQALQDYQQGKYETVVATGKQFLRQSRNAPEAGFVQYLIGEALYAQKRYEAAIVAFDEVVQKYPQDPKVATAILKTGVAFAELQDFRNARFFLSSVQKKFPNSPEAQLAKLSPEQLLANRNLVEFAPHSKFAAEAKEAGDKLAQSKELTPSEPPVSSVPKTEKEEMQTIEDIVNKGPGSRFRVQEFLTERERSTRVLTGTLPEPVTVRFQSGSVNINYAMFKIGPSGNLEPDSVDLSRLPDGSVLMFEGDNRLRGYGFDGDPQNPLKFVLLRESGLVYLAGKGVVKLKDGRERPLP
jgi:tetratricopeptide (TPR) repeat protein